MEMGDRIHKKMGFTLIEMIIVLIIMGILLMVTMLLSGDQIQKVKDKTVKESILAEMQSRYSRNLGSSSFGGEMYKALDIKLSTGSNEIMFYYYTGSEDSSFFTGHFVDKFEIKYITLNYDNENTSNPKSIGDIKLRYTPYNTSCKIGEGDNGNVVILMRVNDRRDYCFEIKQKNCRLIELSEDNCSNLKNIVHLD